MIISILLPRTPRSKDISAEGVVLRLRIYGKVRYGVGTGWTGQQGELFRRCTPQLLTLHSPWALLLVLLQPLAMSSVCYLHRHHPTVHYIEYSTTFQMGTALLRASGPAGLKMRRSACLARRMRGSRVMIFRWCGKHARILP